MSVVYFTGAGSFGEHKIHTRKLLISGDVVTMLLVGIFCLGMAVFAVPFSQDNNSYTNPVVTTSPVPDLLKNEYNYNITGHQHSYLTSAYDASSGTTWQYYVYWDQNGEATITRRDIANNSAWDTPTNIHTAIGGDALEDDSHNSIGVGIDTEGYIHVTGNHHNDPLNMARSDNPWDITSFSNVSSMIAADAATTENSVTYPNFFNNANGELMILYADGPAGGDRDWYINRWNPDSGTPGQWERVIRLFDGVAENFYPWKVGVDTTGGSTNGRIHIFGTWRIDAGAETNEDLMHLYSDDDGTTWYQYGSVTPLTTPLQFADGARILDTDQPPNSRYILNVGGFDVDWLGRPHAIVKMSTTAGTNNPAQYHVWYDGANWQLTQLSSVSTTRRAALLVSDTEEIFLLSNEQSAFSRKYSLTNITPGSADYDTEQIDLATGHIEDAEPNYDSGILRRDNRLSFNLTRSDDAPAYPENYIQTATIFTLDLDQLDELRANSSLALTKESYYSGALGSTAVVSAGGGSQTVYATTSQIEPDPLNRPLEVGIWATAAVSDGATTGELQFRYQTSGGPKLIGKMSFTETTPTLKLGTAVPLYDLISGNVEVVGEITSGTGNLTIDSMVFSISNDSLEPFPLVSDNDGLDDNYEEQAPNNGDVNNDGTDDRLQDNAGSIWSYILDDTIGVATSDTITSGDPSAISGTDCDVISDFTNPDETSLGDDPSYYYPLGLFDYQISCDTNGAVNYTTFILDGDYTSESVDWILRKYDTVSDSYSTINAVNYTKSTITLDSQTHTLVELRLTEGGTHDNDDTADGTLNAIVGFAQLDGTDEATCLDAEQQLCDYISGNSEWQIWKNTEPGGGGWIMDLSWGPDDSLISATDLGGYYRTTNFGHTWTHHGLDSGYDETHVRSVEHHPTDPNLVFIGSNNGIYKSTDGGLSVTQVYGTNQKVCAMGFVDEVGYASLASAWNEACKTLARTDDFGDTWSTIDTLTDNDHITDIRVNPRDPESVLFLSDEARFYDAADAPGGFINIDMYESNDGGTNIDQVPITEDVFDADWSNDGTKIYFGTAEAGNTGGLYSKPSGYNSAQTLLNNNFTGQVWIPAGTHNVIRLIDQRHYSPPNSRHGIKESTDGGTSFNTYAVWPDDFDYGWKDGAQFTSYAEVAFDFSESNPDLGARRGNQLVIGTTDGGRSIRQMNQFYSKGGYNSTGSNNTVPVTVKQSPHDKDFAIAGLLDMGCWRTLDGGDSWEYCDQDAFNETWPDEFGGNVRDIEFDPTDPDRVWMGVGRSTGTGFILKSDSKGAKGSWIDVGTGLPAGIDAVSDIELDPNSSVDSRTLFITADGDVYRSTDDGLNWSLVFACGTCQQVEMDPDSSLVTAGGNGGFYISNSDGDSGTWSNVTVGTYPGTTFGDIRQSAYRGISDIKDDPNSSGVVWFTLNDSSQGGVWRYESGTATLMESEPEARTVEIATDGTVYQGSSNANSSGAGTQNSRGIRYSTNDGASWNQLTDPFEFPFVTDIQIPENDQESMWVVSPGVGIYKVYKYKQEADLGITITDSGTTVPGGTNGHTYTITVTNNGDADVNEFELTALPFAAGRANFSSISINSGGGSLASISAIAWTWSGTLASGNSIVIDYVVDVVGSDGQNIPMVASVSNEDNTQGNLYATNGTNDAASDIDTYITVNAAPTDIALSPDNIDENVGTNQTVGTLSTTDADGGDAHTYSLVAGAGDTDNASFSISGDSLILQPNPDFETKNSYEVRIQTDDGGIAGTYEKAMTVTINDLNTPPTDISLDSSDIDEGSSIGTTIGTFSNTDDGEDGTYTYTLVAGAGDTDNASFTVSGNQLTSAEVFDFATKSSYSIRVNVNDGANNFAKEFTISINGVSSETACGTAPSGYNIIESNAETITGTSGDDYICAGSSDNTINGLEGDDIIFGGDGNDTIYGDDGSDSISGMDGADLLSGGRNADTIRGGNHNDIIRGRKGSDILYGGNGNDIIYGDSGADVIQGRSGSDKLYGGIGNDSLNGQSDNDSVNGGVGNDRIRGEGGADRLFGNDGVDIIWGGSGSDRIQGDIGNDIINGQEGSDFLFGNGGYDSIKGEGGSDEIYGGLGGDLLEGGNNNDRIFGENGNDILKGNGGDDLLKGGLGADTLIGGIGIDILISGGNNGDFKKQ